MNKSLTGLVNYSSDSLVESEDEDIILVEALRLNAVLKSNKGKPKFMMTKKSMMYLMVLTVSTVKKSRTKENFYALRLRCNVRKSKNVQFDCSGSAQGQLKFRTSISNKSLQINFKQLNYYFLLKNLFAVKKSLSFS
jgi:hypothetical protein